MNGDPCHERSDALTHPADHLAIRLEQLIDGQERINTELQILGTLQEKLYGELLDIRYTRRAHAYFGRWLRRLSVVIPSEMKSDIEDRLESILTPDELAEIYQLDLLAVGRPRTPNPAVGDELWIAAEISAIIDESDVERVDRRSALLKKAGLKVVPVVAGEGLTNEATGLLNVRPIVLVLDGRSHGWEQAVAATA